MECLWDQNYQFWGENEVFTEWDSLFFSEKLLIEITQSFSEKKRETNCVQK